MFHVAEIFPNRRELTRRLAESALLKKITVQPHHFVARIRDERRHNCPDVALMACNEYPHFTSLELSTLEYRRHSVD
jgi:hypothetical protein